MIAASGAAGGRQDAGAYQGLEYLADGRVGDAGRVREVIGGECGAGVSRHVAEHDDGVIAEFADAKHGVFSR